ncbi:hypothetical protein K4K61_011836 [Colletotrichum sp. SAR11_59]|nr:hypothetical protein K4K61_011836 [Colletotrichum sp. SAR11_59]
MDPKQRKRKLSDVGDSAVAKKKKSTPAETGPEAAKEQAASFVGSGGVIHNEGLYQEGWIPKPMETVRDFKKRLNSLLDRLPQDAIVIDAIVTDAIDTDFFDTDFIDTRGFTVAHEGMDYDRGYDERITLTDCPEDLRFARLEAQAAAAEEEADEENVVYEGTDWDRGYEEELLPEHDPVEHAKIAAERREIRAERVAAARARKAAIKARNDAIEAAASNDAGHDEATEVSSSKTGAQPSTSNLSKMGEYETHAPAVPVHTPAVPVQGHNYQNVWNHGPRIIQAITNFTRPPHYTRALRPDDLKQHETSKDRRSINERPAPGQRCGNCYHWGHGLIDCTFSPAHGAITGCPFCNTKEHNLDECIRILVDISWLDLFHSLLERRRGKCGIRTSKYLWMVLGRAAKERKDGRFRSIKFDDRGPFSLTVNFVRAILKRYKHRDVYALNRYASQGLHWVWYDYSTNLPPAVDPMTEDWRAVEDNYDELPKTEEHGHIRELKKEKKEKAKTGLGKDVSAHLPQDSNVAPKQPQGAQNDLRMRPRGPKRDLGMRPRGPNNDLGMRRQGLGHNDSNPSQSLGKGESENIIVNSEGTVINYMDGTEG